MNLLIVDDEPQIRESMTRYISGLGLGFHQIRTAGSGVEALQICDAFRPDLLIVDILMPEMDGIQTIEHLVARLPGVQCIIISGCNDFQYVKSALRYPVEDYVLKPIQLPELNAALNRAIEKCAQACDDAERQRRMGWFQQALPDMQERFLAALLHGRYADGGYLRDTALALGLTQLLDRPTLVSVVRLRDELGDALDFSSLMRVLPKYLTDADRIIWADDMLMAVLTALDGDGHHAGQLSTRLEQMLDLIEQRERIQALCGIGTQVQGAADLGDSFRQACNAAQVAAVSSRRLMTAADALFGDERGGARTRVNSDSVWTLKAHLLRGDTQAMRRCAVEMVLGLAGQSPADPARLWCAKLELIRVYAKLLQSMGAEAQPNQLAAFAQLDHLSSLDQIADWFEARLLRLMDSTILQRTSRAESVAQWMAQQIRYRYCEPLSLQVFADETNLSVNYLSQVFGERVGISFSNYLADCRMGRAVELLGDVRIPISQIGSMVGYDNPNYFSRLFRKRHAMSPSEYRERLMHES